MNAQKTDSAPTQEFAVIGTRPPRYDAADKATGRE